MTNILELAPAGSLGSAVRPKSAGVNPDVGDLRSHPESKYSLEREFKDRTTPAKTFNYQSLSDSKHANFCDIEDFKTILIHTQDPHEDADLDFITAQPQVFASNTMGVDKKSSGRIAGAEGMKLHHQFCLAIYGRPIDADPYSDRELLQRAVDVASSPERLCEVWRKAYQ